MKHGKRTRLPELSPNALRFSVVSNAFPIFLETRLYNLMTRQKNLANFSSSTIHVPIVELRKYFSQARNLIPIESGHTRAAERGENRVYLISVLKFQEAEVGCACYKGSFLLVPGHYTYVDFPREIRFPRRVDFFTSPFAITSLHLPSLLLFDRDMQYFLSLCLSRSSYHAIDKYRPPTKL